MGLVAELDAAEIAFGPLLAFFGLRPKPSPRPDGGGGGSVLTINPLQAGMGGPGLQQGAIYRKVLIAEQRLDLRRAHQLLHEAAHDLVIEEPLAVLGKGSGVPDRIVGAQADKPAVQLP